jgi:uncharacterized protein
MISRDAALELLKAQQPDTHLLNHSLQSEAVMRGLAAHFNEDAELWGLTGLLHDVDFSHTKETPDNHGLMAMDILGDNLPEEALHAIKAHNSEYTNCTPESRLDYALRAAESVTGLVSANALVRPEGMSGMKPKSLKKKMKEKAFAANVDRDRIREFEKIEVEAGEFFQIAIDAISPIATETGLK